MSIPIAERIAKPSSMGIPCSICLRIERLSQLISKAQSYLNKQFTRNEKRAFWRGCSKQAVEEARQIWERLDRKEKKNTNLRILIRRRLRSFWTQEQRERELHSLRGKRLNLLRERMSRLARKHPKCTACLICFGEEHLENPSATPVGQLCQSCLRMYTALGHKKFIKTLKFNEGE